MQLNQAPPPRHHHTSSFVRVHRAPPPPHPSQAKPRWGACLRQSIKRMATVPSNTLVKVAELVSTHSSPESVYGAGHGVEADARACAHVPEEAPHGVPVLGRGRCYSWRAGLHGGVPPRCLCTRWRLGMA
uniref:Uncharacterized protein n=1 Tax=Zea mays TaxID=4577 RepID=C4J2R6_MAIZE|nr:unknown [Zea mays]|eukprot:NP_001183027.1 uncharacterized protein LOC100501353 [Zea mays]